MRIQHNILAMNAYRNYNTNTSALAKNLEKLSSGYKINRAGDDAAGLAISEKMRAQITGLNAAQKNVKDGISLVKTAEGAMQEIQDMLNRMDYLATQSANGTYDNEVDRANLQKEVDQLKAEINRIADSANFNGIKLLDGSREAGGAAAASKTDISFLTSDATGHNTSVQLHKVGVDGKDAGFTIDSNQILSNLKATASMSAGATFTFNIEVGGATIALNVTVASAVATGGAIDLSKLTVTCSQTSVSITDAAGNSYDFKIGTGGGKVLTFTKASSQAQVDFDANLQVTYDFDSTGVEADDTAVENCYTQKVTLGVAKKNDQLAHADFKLTDSMVNSLLNGGKLHIGNAAISFNKDSKDTAANSVGVKDLLNSKGKLDTSDENVMKQLVARISVAAGNSDAFTVGAGSDAATISLQEKQNYYDQTDKKLLDTEEKIHKIVYLEGAADSSAGPLTLQIGDTFDSYNQLKVSIGDMHCKALGIDTLDISKPETASAAIQTIREAINSVSSVRGDLGATQNRLEHTANNLSVMAENIQDAESTIRDTDVAEEMMAYTKNNILIQSAQAMLAQANAVPQGVLQLLG